MPKRALIVVDLQNDFCSGGALPVPGGDEVVPILRELAHEFRRAGELVVATRDWHPPDSKHFVSGGGRWPPHCVQGSAGARFHPELELPQDAVVVSAGSEPDEDGYSGFDGRSAAGESLEALLRRHQVEELWVGGLATDYCVCATVHDGLRLGFRVILLTDAVRGIDAEPGDVDRALSEMARAGAELSRASAWAPSQRGTSLAR